MTAPGPHVPATQIHDTLMDIAAKIREQQERLTALQQILNDAEEDAYIGWQGTLRNLNSAENLSEVLINQIIQADSGLIDP